mgnify:FL=1
MCEEDKVFLLFGSIKKKLYKLINGKIKEYNLTVPEAIYLIVISKYESLSYKEITSIVDYDKAMTTKVLNSLKDKEFVSNNIKNIVLTEKGILVTDKVINELNLLKSEILGKVSEREISKFYKKLNQFNQILEGIC